MLQCPVRASESVTNVGRNSFRQKSHKG
jgi:hypothetical protein